MIKQHNNVTVSNVKAVNLCYAYSTGLQANILFTADDNNGVETSFTVNMTAEVMNGFFNSLRYGLNELEVKLSTEQDLIESLVSDYNGRCEPDDVILIKDDDD